jgi:CRP/FNR family transcriptional regulator, cyclic AMP receptor protein
MNWTDLFGNIGSLFVVASASMKTMVPLRLVGIFANMYLIVYYFLIGSYTSLIVQAIILPVNAYRMHQMLRLIKNVRGAVRGNPSMEWLKPFMTRRHFRKGDVLFAKNEPADEMFYTVTGRFRLIELGIELQSGQVVGELGMLAPDNRRTATLECIEDGDVLSITYEQVEQLYFQNPTFGFYFLRLSTARLFQNLNRLENELARLKATAATVKA